MYNTIPIKKISPVEKTFPITWRIDLRCNFDCMYCPSFYHDSKSQTKTLDQLQKSWIKIFNQSKDKNLKYTIGFTGGEVTINKDFLPFIKWLKTNYDNYIFQMGVSTNGSASLSYYTELINYVEYISFSTHSEFFNEKKFFENVVRCNELINGTSKTIQVCIMKEPWHEDRIKSYINFLTKHNISYSINEIDFSYKIRDDHKVNINKQRYEFTS